ncbi:MAG: peptidoglycan-associated lipoprotein Pal [Alphaproteobacteria bacterium]|nr:peptidoglycan-associated lipoprotein Pal [Alphaproteobacteria bacterium]
MNLFTKTLALVAATFILSACDSTPGGSGNGTGGQYGSGGPGTGSGELAQGVSDRVFFEYDSSSISSEGQKTLAAQAAWLKANSGVNVTVEGHCDERGTREYNIALGERRASSTKKYLTGLGVASSRINTISYGKERPAVIGEDESAWSQNRRGVTIISTK